MIIGCDTPRLSSLHSEQLTVLIDPICRNQATNFLGSCLKGELVA